MLEMTSRFSSSFAQVFASHHSTQEVSAYTKTIGTFPSIEHFNTTDGLDYESSRADLSLISNAEKRRFSLRYPVVMPRLSAVHNPDPNLCPPWLKPTERLTNQNAYPRFHVERGLETPDQNDVWDEKGKVATMDGQVTYWSRRNTEDGWDGMSLLTFYEATKGNICERCWISFVPPSS